MRNRESEMAWVFPNGWMNDPRAWNSESMYYAGTLGETDEAALMVTPSGASTRQAETPWYETLIKTAVPVLSTAYQQSQMTKLNLARINQGQPPLTAQQYAAAYQPPGARVELGMTSQTQKLLLWGAGGLALLVGLRAAKII